MRVTRGRTGLIGQAPWAASAALIDVILALTGSVLPAREPLARIVDRLTEHVGNSRAQIKRPGAENPSGVSPQTHQLPAVSEREVSELRVAALNPVELVAAPRPDKADGALDD